MNKTNIEWTEYTWNPVTGCSPCSPGCEHCYAKRMAKRLVGRWGYPSGDGFAVTVHPDKLGEPRRWKKPRVIFVCSMGDLFHKDVTRGAQTNVFWTMADCPQHRFLLLTKRPDRMQRLLNDQDFARTVTHGSNWPLPNVGLGTTVESDEQRGRLEDLIETPAAMRYVSVEPMLGPLDIYRSLAWIDWVIAGGENGPGARGADPQWFYDLRDQCVNAGAPFFFKGRGAAAGGTESYRRTLDGKAWHQRPAFLTLPKSGGHP